MDKTLKLGEKKKRKSSYAVTSLPNTHSFPPSTIMKSNFTAALGLPSVATLMSGTCYRMVHQKQKDTVYIHSPNTLLKASSIHQFSRPTITIWFVFGFFWYFKLLQCIGLPSLVQKLCSLFIMDECYLSHITVWLQLHSCSIDNNGHYGMYISVCLFICLTVSMRIRFLPPF